MKRQGVGRSARGALSVLALAVPCAGHTCAQASPLSLEQEIRAAYGAPSALAGHAQTWTQLGAEAVFVASRLTGGKQVVSTGTLTQTAGERLEFEYSRAPADHLHVVMKDGASVDYYVAAIEGDLTVDAASLLSGPHHVALRVVVPRKLDLTLSSRRAGTGPLVPDGAIESSARGTLLIDEREASVDVRGAGTYYFAASLGGVESRSDVRTQGTIQLGALLLRVDERWAADMRSGTKQKPDGKTSAQEFASSYVRASNTSWTSGDSERALRNGEVRTAFLDGVPLTADDSLWQARGEVVVGDEVVGALSFARAAKQVRLVVALEPEPIVLQTWPLPRADD